MIPITRLDSLVDGDARFSTRSEQGGHERHTALRDWLDDYKRALTCLRCGFADFLALEFHHPGGVDKDFNVSDMIRSGLSRQTILREIAKCVILCSNCHQIEHYEDQKR